MRRTLPPSWGLRLLAAFVAEPTAEALSGDLIEQYQRGRSRAWFWRQVLAALAISAAHEARSKRVHTLRALIIGYVVAAGLCYVTTSLVARFVWGYKAYLVFLPFVFFSAAASGWVVRRTHDRPMVLVWTAFCIVASIAAFAAYAWLPLYDTIPVPILAFFAVSDFVIGPAGVLAGGLWASSSRADLSTSPSADAP